VKTTADVLIVGSGAAGLTAALNLAETHKVAVIAKGALGEGATSWAQGGIAAVLEEGDSFDAHVNDTMIAGAGLNDRAVVEHVVTLHDHDPMPDEHRYCLAWGRADAAELRARRKRLAGTLEGPYRGKRTPWLWRVLGAVWRWVTGS
jgi:succinate dehydrogenase/fumarate reductase flavoprotein subunit